nr:hypothetical protein [Streptomyces sudanensis]
MIRSRPDSAVDSTSPWAPNAGMICSATRSTTSCTPTVSVRAAARCSSW